MLGGKKTETCRLQNNFYGLTDMPAAFQKTIDQSQEGIKSKFVFLQDILVTTKGNLKHNEKVLDKIVQKLDQLGVAFSLAKLNSPKMK